MENKVDPGTTEVWTTQVHLCVNSFKWTHTVQTHVISRSTVIVFLFIHWDICLLYEALAWVHIQCRIPIAKKSTVSEPGNWECNKGVDISDFYIPFCETNLVGDL